MLVAVAMAQLHVRLTVSLSRPPVVPVRVALVLPRLLAVVFLLQHLDKHLR